MKATSEMMAKLENCKSAEEVLELAKSYNVVINKKQAQDAFELLKSEDVSDEMLEKVCGGEVIAEGVRIRSGAGYFGDGAGIGGGDKTEGIISRCSGR